MVAEVGFEPHDLRVMSPTSYQAALLRDIFFSICYYNTVYFICQAICANFFIFVRKVFDKNLYSGVYTRRKSPIRQEKGLIPSRSQPLSDITLRKTRQHRGLPRPSPKSIQADRPEGRQRSSQSGDEAPLLPPPSRNCRHFLSAVRRSHSRPP